MTAETIAKALGGRKVGGGWIARCPAHDDREPSLSIRDGDNGVVLVHCHAGCDQTLVIAALRSRGLWGDVKSTPSAIAQEPHDDPERSETALRIWGETASAAGTPVETYLVSRGLRLPPPLTLRFHPGLAHPSGTVWPAMVALVTSGSDDEPMAIHRTFLAPDGGGKAPVTPSKMMLGPCRGGAVRLTALGDVLMVGEGIETCLTALQAKGLSAWAALSTSGLRTLDLPHDARDVMVLADGDDAGETAARDCARRWKREGRRVRIARPPPGLDFNDMLLGRTSHVEEAAK
jgi:hypothetical protein